MTSILGNPKVTWKKLVVVFFMLACNNNNNNNNNNKGLICKGPSTFLLPQNLDMFVFEDGDHVFLENGRRDSFRNLLCILSKDFGSLSFREYIS